VLVRQGFGARQGVEQAGRIAQPPRADHGLNLAERVSLRGPMPL
jgi:hypothetical protein